MAYYKKRKSRYSDDDRDDDGDKFLDKIFNHIIREVSIKANAAIQQAWKAFFNQNPEVKKTIDQIDTFNLELEHLKKRGFSDKEAYDLKRRYEPLYNVLHQEDCLIKNEKIDAFFRAYINIDYYKKRSSNIEREREKQRVAYLLEHIDGKALEEAQKDAVVCEEENCLVIAGAGSGKTLTIAGKVAYLVKEKGVIPDEILLITFTTKAAQEMEERIITRLNIPVKVKTFHALGNEIIAQVEQRKSSVQEQNKYILNEYFENSILQTPGTLQELIRFFAQYLYCPPHVENYNDLGEYYSRLKGLNLKTLKDMVTEQEADKLTFKGEKVKSIEELIIANFFYLNGIAYEYERKYEFEVADIEHKQYQPDFYLPEIGLYIEHFGINRQGDANWLPPIENKKYQEGMQWKRQLHKEKKTKLYETYSFQFNEGNILEILEHDLKKLGVNFKPLSSQQIHDRLMRKENKYFSELKKLMWTFLNLFKSHHYDISHIEKLQAKAKQERNPFIRGRMLSFLEVFKGLLSYYEGVLEQTQTIDFNDMINKATDYVAEGKLPMNYQYIIIDEYQDSAYARYALVKAIKNRTKAKIMAVGDDWQSIYRFAGSDMSLFINFEKLFGMTERIYIEKTYRNSQELIDIAGSFVTKNPLQLQKRLQATQHLEQPIRLIGYKEDIQKALIYTLGKLNHQGVSKEIMVLGRNNFDLQVLQGSTHFQINMVGQDKMIRCIDYPNLKISFLTVHKAKGLEAEEVIILNCKNDLLGFPNQLADDPILDLVMTQGDYYLHGEERRLFYVALTRTKKHCYLLVPENNPSCFVNELIKDYGLAIEYVEESQIQNEKVTCPRCQSGLLVKRIGNGRSFLGCSNFPFCSYTIKEVGILSHPMKCSECGAYMVKRRGSRGMFYGCTNYPTCTNTKPYVHTQYK